MVKKNRPCGGSFKLASSGSVQRRACWRVCLILGICAATSPIGATMPLFMEQNGCTSEMSFSIPGQRPTRLILNHSRLEEILLLLQIDHLRHPREGVVGLVEQRVDTNLLAT